MDFSNQYDVPKRLHYLKCSRCRKDKKKCLPFDRSWPGEKCHRCAEHNYGCSDSMTASQDKQRQQQQNATSHMPPPLRPEQSSGVESIVYNSQQGNYRLLGEQADDKPSWPKCAPYFSTLIKASWEDFGRPEPSEADPYEVRLKDITDVETVSIYWNFQSRLFGIDISRRYQYFVQERIACGMGLEESRAYASRRLAYEAGKDDGEKLADDTEANAFVLSLDSLLTVALRWQSLMDAVGTPEVLLIRYDEDETKYWGDLPLPDVASVSDDEWPSLLQALLSPALGLKETCLKLSGVIDMIERLDGLEESELRTYLATSLGQRVKKVLGTEKSLPGQWGGYDDEDDSMADFE